MENIINQLSEIEHSAAEIVDHAAEEKIRLKEELEQKQQLLDAEITEKTQQKLNELTQHLEQSKAQALHELRQKTDAILISLEQEFEAHHSDYAQALFKKITEA